MPKNNVKNSALIYSDYDYSQIFKELGRNVRSLREQMGLTLDDVSEQTHIDRTTLSRLENGAQNPKFGTVLSVACVLGTDPASLCPTLFAGASSEASWTNLHTLFLRLPDERRLEAYRCMEAMLIGLHHQHLSRLENL